MPIDIHTNTSFKVKVATVVGYKSSTHSVIHNAAAFESKFLE